MSRGGRRPGADELAANKLDSCHIIGSDTQDRRPVRSFVDVEVDPGVVPFREAGRLDDLLVLATQRYVNDSILVHGSARYRRGVALTPGGIR